MAKKRSMRKGDGHSQRGSTMVINSVAQYQALYEQWQRDGTPLVEEAYVVVERDVDPEKFEKVKKRCSEQGVPFVRGTKPRR